MNTWWIYLLQQELEGCFSLIICLDIIININKEVKKFMLY